MTTASVAGYVKSSSPRRDAIGKTSITELLSQAEFQPESSPIVVRSIGSEPRRRSKGRKQSQSDVVIDKFPNVKTRSNASLTDLLSPARILKGKIKEVDKQKNPPTQVGDLVSNIHSLEKLVTLLKAALAKATSREENVESCVKFVQDGFAEIMNPHHVLELELARLVEAKMPPNNELYSSRDDKSEFAVSFFKRVYWRFYDAGVLYRHQLRAMDGDFYNILGNYPEIALPKKEALISNQLASMGGDPAKLTRMASAAYRRMRTV